MVGIEGFRVRRSHDGDIVRRIDGAEVRTCGLGSGEAALVESLSDFSFFFAPALPSLESLSWIVNDPLFYFPEAEPADLPRLLEEWTVEEDETRWAFMRPGFLRKFSPYLVDDWLDMFGVESLPVSLERFKAGYYSGPKSISSKSYVLSRAEVAILCIDGVAWEFFAKDPALLSLLEAHWKNKPGIQVTPRTYGDEG